MIRNPSTVASRPDLGVMFNEAMANGPMNGFIASRVFPFWFVGNQSGRYNVLPAKALFNVVETRRASGAGYSRSSEAFEAGLYATDEYGHEQPLDDRFVAMYRDEIEAEAIATRICIDKVMRGHEARAAAKVTTANYNSGACGTTWADHDNADPKNDVDGGVDAMRTLGVSPNVMIITWTEYRNLCNCAAIKEGVYNLFPDQAKTGTIKLPQLETYLDIPIVLAGAMANTAKKPKDTSLTDIWTAGQATLARIAAPGDPDFEPCMGRTFAWNEGAGSDLIVEEYYSEETRARIIRARFDVDLALIKSLDEDKNVLTNVSKNCAHIITGVNAAAE